MAHEHRILEFSVAIAVADLDWIGIDLVWIRESGSKSAVMAWPTNNRMFCLEDWILPLELRPMWRPFTNFQKSKIWIWIRSGFDEPGLFRIEGTRYPTGNS
jgi:hypothetical protein